MTVFAGLESIKKIILSARECAKMVRLPKDVLVKVSVVCYGY